MPVEGVEITVLDADGAEVGTATTDADGQFEIPLPGPGDYTVLLDEDTLPDDVELRDEAHAELVVNVRPDERQILNYFLGESLRQTEGRWDQLPQTIANGIKFGLIIAITAVGLSLIYGTTGLSNFAHGELVTLGAIVAVVDEPERRHPHPARRLVRHRRRRRWPASSPSGHLAAAAQQGRRPDVDDDRLDRRSGSRPATSTCTSSAAAPRPTASTPCRSADRHRADLAHRRAT